MSEYPKFRIEIGRADIYKLYGVQIKLGPDTPWTWDGEADILLPRLYSYQGDAKNRLKQVEKLFNK